MRILIIRFSSLGDIVLTEPIISSLRKEYKDCTIDYLTKSVFSGIVSEFMAVDNVYTDYKRLSDLSKLRRLRYDIVIDLHGKFNSFWSRLIISGKKTVVYNKQRLLRQKIVKKRSKKSIYSTVDLYNSVLEKLGISFMFVNPRLNITKKDITFLPKKSNFNIVIFPGATHATKRLPTSKLKLFIEELSDNDISFYGMGSKNEIDIIDSLVSGTTNSYNLGGKFSLKELVYAVNEADLVITNDSGPMHIAAALGKRQIAFFGSTNLRLGFRPLNKNAIVIAKDLPCSPCTLHGEEKCPLGHFKCMKSISLDDIMQAYHLLLDESSKNF